MPAISLGIRQRNWLEMYLFARESGRLRLAGYPCVPVPAEQKKKTKPKQLIPPTQTKKKPNQKKIKNPQQIRDKNKAEKNILKFLKGRKIYIFFKCEKAIEKENKNPGSPSPTAARIKPYLPNTNPKPFVAVIEPPLEFPSFRFAWVYSSHNFKTLFSCNL